MAEFINASPESIHLGTFDKSTRDITPERERLPQHLPKLFVKTRKGTSEPTIGSLDKLLTVFGRETFDPDSIYYNHQTRFLTHMLDADNVCMIKRIIPDDAGIKSNLTIYVDILDKEIPNYLRDSRGGYIVDVNTNSFKVDPTTPAVKGKEIKFITEYDSTTDSKLGTKVPKNGTMKYKIDSNDVNLFILQDNRDVFTVGNTLTGTATNASGEISKIVYINQNHTVITVKDVTGTFDTTDSLSDSKLNKHKIQVVESGVAREGASTMYPFLQIKAKNQGEYYNNIGISIGSLYGTEADADVMSKLKVMPLKLAVHTRDHAGATSNVVRTLFGAPDAVFSFKKGATNPKTKVKFGTIPFVAIKFNLLVNSIPSPLTLP